MLELFTLLLLVPWLSPPSSPASPVAVGTIGDPGAPVRTPTRLRGPRAGRTRLPAPEEVEAAVDRLLVTERARLGVPGTAFVYVRDDRVAIARGYGVADLETGRPIRPDRTMFRVASISKLFTATALMILADRGRIDLDRDVDDYLERFRLPPAREPVTIRMLLTHTAGFDERYLDLHKRHRTEVTPLAEFLSRHMPGRELEPGRLYSYSNHGSCLAGLVIEDVSSLSFEEFVAREIFEPLGMERSSFVLDPKTEARLATAYDRVDTDRPVPVALSHANVVPAGGLNSTPLDIARFIRLHLNRGVFEGRRLLSECAIARMHRRQFTHDPRLPGMALGFAELERRGVRALRHNGYAPGYVSLLLIAPDDGWGFLITSTAVAAYPMHDELARLMVDLHGDDPIVRPADPPPDPDLGRYAGCYRFLRHPRRTFDMLPVLHSDFAPELEIRRSPAGLVLAGHGGPPVLLVQEGRGLFRRQDEDTRVAFRESSDGSVTHLFTAHSTGPGAFERRPWWDTRRAHRALVFLFVVVFLAGIGWSLTELGPDTDPGRAALRRSGRRMVLCSSVTSLVVLFGQPLCLFPLEGGFPQHTFGLPWPVVLLQGAALLLVPGALRRARTGSRLIRGPGSARTDGAWLLGDALVSVLYLVFLDRFNLVGFRF